MKPTSVPRKADGPVLEDAHGGRYIAVGDGIFVEDEEGDRYTRRYIEEKFGPLSEVKVHMKLNQDEAMKLATSTWGHVLSVDEVETKPGSVIRRTTGPAAKNYGKPIIQQFKVRLHSGTGPLHWMAILEDGSASLD